MNQGGKKEPGPSASSVVGWSARGFDPWVEYCLPHRVYFPCTVGVARAAKPLEPPVSALQNTGVSSFGE